MDWASEGEESLAIGTVATWSAVAQLKNNLQVVTVAKPPLDVEGVVKLPRQTRSA